LPVFSLDDPSSLPDITGGAGNGAGNAHERRESKVTSYGKLTPGKIGKLRLPAGKANIRVGDGGGLYLQVTKTAKGGETKAWLFRFTSPVSGKKRDMGLGELVTINLSDAEKARKLTCDAIDKARTDAHEARLLIRDGIDPIDARKAKKAEAKAETGTHITFEEAAERFIKGHKATWTNAEHVEQWRATLGIEPPKPRTQKEEKKAARRAKRRAAMKSVVLPDSFKALRVDLITKAHVTKVLEEIWNEKPETASRLRARIEKVLGWAKAHGYRTGENPAAWKDNLKEALPNVAKLKKPKAERHHAAMPYDAVPGFMVRLRGVDTKPAVFLEVLILTAVRLGELRQARWREFDIGAGVWTIPTEKAKHRKAPHRVALCPRVIEILEELGDGGKDPDALVFPGEFKTTVPVSESAVDRLLGRLADPLPDGRRATLHGMRAAFSSWRAARTAFPADAAEAQLGHLLGRDDTERAYQREDLLEVRFKVMAAWQRHCLTPPEEKGAVIPLRAVAEERG
jgi:integrase